MHVNGVICLEDNEEQHGNFTSRLYNEEGYT